MSNKKTFLKVKENRVENTSMNTYYKDVSIVLFQSHRYMRTESWCKVNFFPKKTVITIIIFTVFRYKRAL